MTTYETVSISLVGAKTVVEFDPSVPAGSYWVERSERLNEIPQEDPPREISTPAPRAKRRAAQK